RTMGRGKGGVDSGPFGGGGNRLGRSGRPRLVRWRAHSVLGFHAWLRTPREALRIGGAAYRSTLRRDLVVPPPTPSPATAPEDRSIFILSADGKFKHFTVRGEYSQTHDGDSRDRTYYGQLLLPVGKLGVNLQYEKYWVSWYAGLRAGVVSGGARGMAACLTYSVPPWLVLKAEAHDGEAFSVLVPPPTTRYGLLSLAVSF